MRALPERLLRFYQSATGKKETRISRIAMPHNEACNFWRGMGDRIGAVRVAKRLYGFDTTRAVPFLEELSPAYPSGSVRSNEDSSSPIANRMPRM
jgi:hypothetical protein